MIAKFAISNIEGYMINTFRNLRSSCNFLIALECASFILIGTSSYYNGLMFKIGLNFIPIVCFAVNIYARFVTYFPATITLSVAVDRYIHVKFASWYILFLVSNAKEMLKCALLCNFRHTFCLIKNLL